MRKTVLLYGLAMAALTGILKFSKKYGWVNDKYGVSWQLTLADG